MNATCTHRICPLMQPWLDALRKLCALGWSDRLAASTLSPLTLPAVEILNAAGWLRADIERLTDECRDGRHSGARQIFSRWRVWHLRHQHGIERGVPRVCVWSKPMLERRRAYQTAAGWAHLLPKWDKAERAYIGGRVLLKREVDVLSVLKEATMPHTRREIARVLGMTGSKLFHSNGRSCLWSLVRAGLVLSSKGHSRAGRWLFAISPTALPEHRPPASAKRKYG